MAFGYDVGKISAGFLVSDDEFFAVIFRARKYSVIRHKCMERVFSFPVRVGSGDGACARGLVQRVYIRNLIKDNFRISTATAYYMTDHNFHKSTTNTEYIDSELMKISTNIG